MNLPNRLTLLRIFLSFVLMFLLWVPGLPAKLGALVVFAVAGLTDWWDGLLARRQKLITDFGILMDPIADKVLVLSAFIAFVQLQVVAAWIVVVIAAREFLITGLRLFALEKGQVLPAEAAGKYKTVLQMTAISLTLIYLVLREAVPSGSSAERAIRFGPMAIELLMFLTVALTLTSGISFLWHHRKIIRHL
ncbi:MAG: CDP-diacylglycerol--glycerol-3-phosphate 3-phosphatidyltransferase [Candidatus Omnitrophica bacterium]|nr:CDP-diacylglycerol--glycerol-3-phosphate 3-phosphatidyltransferase [Candidatus Omnitrophota bacterium]